MTVCILIIGWILPVDHGSAAQEQNYIEDVKLPAGWEVQKIITVPQDRLKGFSERLGGELVSAKNYILDIKGIMLRVNIAEAKTEQDAQKIHQAFLSLHKKEEECLLKGSKVFEFISNSTQLIEIARALFSGEGSISQDLMENLEQTTWEVKIILAPIEKADYMSANDLFNLLRSYQKNPEKTYIQSKIRELKKRFTFSNALQLRYENPPWGHPEYSLAQAEKSAQAKDSITYTLDEPPTTLGIPRVEISAQIPVKAFSCYQPAYETNEDRLTAATAYWPTNETNIIDLLGSIIHTEMTAEQKTESIHDWILKNFKYGGETVGSRYGVQPFLEQKYGRCWDFCDLFVTLCRTAKIPARQVMGWIYGKSGHVWAEVYIPERGWCSIDPSTPSSGVTTDYVPFFISENGELPAIYWEEPELRRMSHR